MKNKQTESWEERFDEEFTAESIWVVPSDDNRETIREIKQFIAQELQRAREDALEAVRVSHDDVLQEKDDSMAFDDGWISNTTQYDENVKKFLGEKKSQHRAMSHHHGPRLVQKRRKAVGNIKLR